PSCRVRHVAVFSRPLIFGNAPLVHVFTFTSAVVPPLGTALPTGNYQNMIGVRLFSRGSGAFRTDIARCLIVFAALCAQDVTPVGESFALAGTKADAEAVDPFLEEDTQPPSGDEIPPVPEQESKPKPEKPKPSNLPKVDAPRLPREIKQTKLPQQ